MTFAVDICFTSLRIGILRDVEHRRKHRLTRAICVIGFTSLRIGILRDVELSKCLAGYIGCSMRQFHIPQNRDSEGLWNHARDIRRRRHR